MKPFLAATCDDLAELDNYPYIGLMKFKRWLDDDAVIVGRKARLKNNNPKLRDALGNAKRSKNKANLLELDTLGALLCSYKGVNFDIGTGFDDETAMRIWKMSDKELYSHRVKFKYKSRCFRYILVLEPQRIFKCHS